MKKVEKAKLQRLIRQSLRSLCEAGLPQSTNICIEGLIGITVNTDYIVLVNVHEEIGESEETDSVDCMPHHDSSSEVNRGRFHHGLQGKIMQRSHAHAFRRHMMQAMHAEMAGHGREAHSNSMGTSRVNQTPSRAFTKGLSTNQIEKEGYEFVDFNEDDMPVPSQAFQMPPSNLKDIASLREDKNSFDFSNFEKMFSSQGQPDSNEVRCGQEATLGNQGSPNEGVKGGGNPEEVQASTICITPVVENVRPDESNQAIPQQKQPSSGSLDNQESITDSPTRKLGVLIAIKQEGASKRSAKRQLETSAVHVEEISDNDVMLSEGTSDMDTSAMTADIDAQTIHQAQIGLTEDLNAHGENMEFDTFPHDVGHSLLQPEDHQSGLCDVDESLFQILPEVNIRAQDSQILDVVEVEDASENDINVKGEPREDKLDVESRDKSFPKSDEVAQTVSNQRLEKLMSFQKTFEDEVNSTPTKMAPGQDQSAVQSGTKPLESVSEEVHSDDSQDIPGDADGFLHPPYEHVYPRVRGGMFGRPGMFRGRGGAMFGRGAGMMGFGPGPPFFMMGGPKKRIWRCHVCGRFFVNKTNFETHMLKHENKGQGDAGLSDDVGMTCPYCNKRFRFKSWLDQHITTHTKEKLFHCPYCSKAYTRRRNVRKHMEMSHADVLGVPGEGEIQNTNDVGTNSIVIN